MALIPNATTMPRGIIGTWANMEEDNPRTGVASVEFASAIPFAARNRRSRSRPSAHYW